MMSMEGDKFKLKSSISEREANQLAEYERLKAEGAKNFNQKNWTKAIECFNQACDVIIISTKSKSKDDRDTRARYYAVCKSNAAQCYINLNDFKGAISCTSEALSKDRTNVKALHRRGVSYMSLEEGLENQLKALTDFQDALALDPINKGIGKLLKKVVNECYITSMINGGRGNLRFSELLKVHNRFTYAGACINSKENKLGASTLHVASYFGFLNVVTLLLSLGAALNDKSVHGETPVMAASNVGHFDIVKLLLSRGASVHERCDRSSASSLCFASAGGHVSIVDLLLTYGANVHDKEIGGCSSLFAASEGGHIEVFKLLLSKGANIHEESLMGKTCLMVAGKEEIKSIITKWDITMALIVLQELRILSAIDPSSFIGMQKLMG